MKKLLLIFALLSPLLHSQSQINSFQILRLGKQSTAPANPPINASYVYFDGTNVVCVTSAGASCLASSGGSGTVTSVGLAGTANQITVTGSTPITGSGSWTLSLPSSLVLPSGTTATTQSVGDNSTKVATTAYVAANAGGGSSLAATQANYESDGVSLTTIASAFGRNVTSGDLLFAIVADYTGGTITTPTCTDTVSSTWSAVGNTGLNTAQNNTQSWMFKATAASSGADTVTCSGLVAGHLDLAILEYPAATIDVSHFANSAANTCSSNSGGISHTLTGAAANTVLVYGFVNGQADTGGNVPGYLTEIDSLGQISTDTLKVFDRSTVATGTFVTKYNSISGGICHSGAVAFH